jgi:hypothetical protein
MADEIPDFHNVVDVLRLRMYDADSLNSSEMHSFKKKLLADYEGKIPERWYWELWEELDAQGHLDRAASAKLNQGDAGGRLSADGREYLRQLGERP